MEQCHVKLKYESNTITDHEITRNYGSNEFNLKQVKDLFECRVLSNCSTKAVVS